MSMEKNGPNNFDCTGFVCYLYYNPMIEDNYDRINFEDITLAKLQLLSAQTIISKMSKKI